MLNFTEKHTTAEMTGAKPATRNSGFKNERFYEVSCFASRPLICWVVR